MTALDDMEFANKANIEAARKFKGERDALMMTLRRIRSLDDKNISKARTIAAEALERCTA
jgi:hypothetical protein